MGRYLQNQNGIFYFRRKVPRILIDRLGKSEIKRSLRTSCRKLANIRAAKLYLKSEELFEQARMKKNLSIKHLNAFATSSFLNDLELWDDQVSS